MECAHREDAELEAVEKERQRVQRNVRSAEAHERDELEEEAVVRPAHAIVEPRCII